MLSALRQLLASLAVLLVAGLIWLYLVPSAPRTLESWDISLPFGPKPTEQVGPTGGGRGGAGPDGGGRRGGFAGRQTNVITAAVRMATINSALSAVGEASAARSVSVAAPAGGELAEVLVRPGQTVEAGDVIARFKSEAEQIEFDGAQLALEDAEAALARTQGLASSNIVANTALTAAELAKANAELELRNARLALDRKTITSPIGGTVGLIRVNPGNYVAAQTAITTIDDTSSILIDFWVPERYAGQIDVDQPVTVSATALPGQEFTGTVSAIDSRIDPASRTLQVQAEIPNPDGRLRAGMSFAVRLDFPGETYPAVNPLAILWSAQGSYVWKYEAGKATKVMAEIIQRNSDGVLVRADLAAGDPVITEGILQLSEGADVNLIEGPDGRGDEAETASAASAAPAGN
ncbi:efflux RND transporter periplasmic adaptor subunit [Devosia sp. PTR5]|uniref:Efflux RND transporter periplasmic adaptor subunit n=1 Tax=Devosia oryzisoli TaxID=2774138 RepID=A0A927FPI1_9HYPH|nr:efflux RND transporter periplasmic adaptor subunit [Devosia oryzisoli]MBD8063865.1 efflux RND transporter periplasmic adaptor subunit [Devosia oryzisoli]